MKKGITLTDKEKYETAMHIAKHISQQLGELVTQYYEYGLTDEDCDVIDTKRLLLAQEVLNIVHSRFF